MDDLNPLVELGILTPDDGDRFSAGDVRRIGLIQSFVAAGIPLDGLAADVRQGGVSLAFLDSPGFDRFPAFSGVTFQELSTQTGVPVELLMVIREAIGSALPAPEDRVREDEMAIVPLIEAQLESESNTRPSNAHCEPSATACVASPRWRRTGFAAR